jgi:hypothetical protein
MRIPERIGTSSLTPGSGNVTQKHDRSRQSGGNAPQTAT